MIKKLAIALDGSMSSIHATNYALELAKVFDAEIKIISIINYSIGNIDAGIYPQEIEKANELRIKELITQIKNEHKNVEINDFETIGIPEKEINKEIKEWKADLLVIGHHTHSFLERLFVKSIEKKLINHIQCPILIIPETKN